MTVTTTANSISYAGNGTTTAFAFPYLFFAPTDLVVTLVVTASGAAVVPAPILNGAATYDYTVTGVVSVAGEYASGATVTFNTAPPSGYTVSLLRSVPATQLVTLIDNTKFPAYTVNAEFDKLTVLIQDANGRVESIVPPAPPSPLNFDAQVTAGNLTVTPTAGADQVMVFSTVIAGNTGSWYNTGNGRYTPPAGKYFIQCCATWAASGGGNATWSLRIRENGVVFTQLSGSGSASFNIPLTLGMMLQASGTDFFDFTGLASGAGMTNQGGVFTAYRVG